MCAGARRCGSMSRRISVAVVTFSVTDRPMPWLTTLHFCIACRGAFRRDSSDGSTHNAVGSMDRGELCHINEHRHEASRGKQADNNHSCNVVAMLLVGIPWSQGRHDNSLTPSRWLHCCCCCCCCCCCGCCWLRRCCCCVFRTYDTNVLCVRPFVCSLPRACVRLFSRLFSLLFARSTKPNQTKPNSTQQHNHTTTNLSLYSTTTLTHFHC